MRTFEIGGDFFDVFETPTGRWAVAIGDVCGKGPEAAVVTSLVRHTLRAVSRSPSAREALALLNEVLVRDELDGRFCTACLAIVDPGPQGVDVDLAVAGHPLPRLIEPDQPARPIGEAGTLLGIIDEPTIGECRFRLADGSTLLLFTDGLLGKDDESQTELRRLEERLRTWTDDADQAPLQLNRSPWSGAEDDIAILALRATP